MNWFQLMREDIRAAMDRDPAARSAWEVFCLYPGLHALWWHRFAHWFYLHKMYFVSRVISQWNRFFTQIEIHPGATIGRRFFIDHGAGVVIGETSEIGDDVLIYQGVVLGGTTLARKKRHPTIANSVVIGSRAIVLGAITVGEGARIGSGSVVIKSVPPGATVVGVPGRIVEEHREARIDLDHNRLPDPVAEAIRLVLAEQDKLEDRIRRLESSAGISAEGDEFKEIESRIKQEFEDRDDK
ncbi:MAG: serine O-acetyltransferase [Dehalococcoidia bacterium]|nr:serine O-acetyltransferase [Dehalococcoidia bacterium]MDD5495352.1 serine O-acetyltransferase [Dehalococcoidia bacterium]